VKPFQALLLCFSLSLAVHGQSATDSISTLILNHVTVVNPTTSSPGRDVAVTIVGDRIRSITPYSHARGTANVVIVDATGKFLISGLWDMHVHALSKNQPDRFFPMFVANGCARYLQGLHRYLGRARFVLEPVS
jgi:adenine deaminase